MSNKILKSLARVFPRRRRSQPGFLFRARFHVLRALRWLDSAVSAPAVADVTDWGFVRVGSDHFFLQRRRRPVAASNRWRGENNPEDAAKLVVVSRLSSVAVVVMRP